MAEDTKHINIDGDRVIAFINAIKRLAEIAEGINIIGVADAFCVGKKVGSIDAVIEQQRVWEKCLESIAKSSKEYLVEAENSKKEIIAIKNTLSQFATVMNSDFTVSAHTRLKEMISLLDRLEHHNQAGTLKLLASLTTNP